MKNKSEPYNENEIDNNNNAMKWGNKYEPVAIKLYETFGPNDKRKKTY